MIQEYWGTALNVFFRAVCPKDLIPLHFTEVETEIQKTDAFKLCMGNTSREK